LFGLFSISLLIFALARPLIAILQGNNLLKVQLFISISNSLIAVVGIVLLTKPLGVSGAATGLLVAELVATLLSAWFAKRWLDRNDIRYPFALFYIAVVSILIAAVSILCMVVWPQYTLPIVGLSMALNCVIAVAYFRTLPALAVQKMQSLFRRRRHAA